MALPDRPTRVGIVGAGGVAERHARVLSSFPDATVVGVADLAPDRAAALAGEVGAEAFPEAELMLAGVEVDCVYVCTPPFARGLPERLAAERGLPLFVEKPLAADLATAEEVAAVVAASGVATGTGYHWRQLDTVAEAAKLLAGRTPGLVVGRWFDKVPPPAWWARKDGSGGQVVEQATHLIDLARHLVGEVATVTALGASCGVTRPDGDVDEATAAVLGFVDGAVGTLTATCLFDRKDETTLEIVAPGLALTLSETELVVTDADGTRRREPATDPRVAVDREFVDVVRGVRPATTVPYEEALRTHRVACAVAASAETGARVSVSPA